MTSTWAVGLVTARSSPRQPSAVQRGSGSTRSRPTPRGGRTAGSSTLLPTWAGPACCTWCKYTARVRVGGLLTPTLA
eukprot:9098847-Lingulodinium_polyedra.AAC.1